MVVKRRESFYTCNTVSGTQSLIIELHYIVHPLTQTRLGPV
jgi:hypothetical protein